MTVKEYLAGKQERRDAKASRAAAREAAKQEQARLREAAAVAVAADEGRGSLDEIADRVLRQQLIAAEVRAAAGLPGSEDAALARTLAGRRVTQRQEISGPGGASLFGAVIYLPRGAPALTEGDAEALEAGEVRELGQGEAVKTGENGQNG